MQSLFKKFALGAAAAAILGCFVAGGAEAADKTVRVGYQKYGTFLLLKARGLLEKRLEPLGFSVAWTEFPGGPQLLEALNVGALDFGITGEAPPIFAQAAGAPSSMSATSLRRRGARPFWCPRIARSTPSRSSRARAWR